MSFSRWCFSRPRWRRLGLSAFQIHSFYRSFCEDFYKTGEARKPVMPFFRRRLKVSVAVKGVLDFCLSLTLMETVARSEKRRNILKAICRYRTYGKVMRKFYLISSVFCFIFKTTLLFQITFRPEHFCLVKKRWNCLVVTTTYSSRSPLLIVTVFWVEFYPVLQYRNNIAHLEMTQSQ